MHQVDLYIFSSKVQSSTVLVFHGTYVMVLTVSGYYALNQARMGELQSLFGQLWKEYALSDSRYLTQNAFVLCMESITAVSLNQDGTRVREN